PSALPSESPTVKKLIPCELREPDNSVGARTVLFSVIIPTYNRRKLLQETLDSVWAQSFTDFEVIVVDDGSTDGTEDVLKPQQDRLKLIVNEHLGPGAARNAGARVAKGQYLAFLDSDDLWFPWTLSTFAELIAKQSNPAILSAKLIPFITRSELDSVDR